MFPFPILPVIAVLSIQLLGQVSSATTYYVSPSGNDNSSGTTPSSPWRSAARASEIIFTSGDAVLFEGGVTHYLTEAGAGLTVRTAAGTASPPIVVASYGNGNAILMGDGSRFDSIVVLNTGGVEVCNISTWDSALATDPHSIKFTGVHALSTGSDDAAPKFASVWFHDISTSGFLYGVAVDSFSSCQGFTGLRIERALATNATGTGISSQGSYSPSCYAHSDLVVAYSAAYWNQVRHLLLGMSRCTIAPLRSGS